MLSEGQRLDEAAHVDHLETGMLLLGFMCQFPAGHVGHTDVGEKKSDIWILVQHFQSIGTILRTKNVQADFLARRCRDL